MAGCRELGQREHSQGDVRATAGETEDASTMHACAGGTIDTSKLSI